jgi:hypothetical protein
VQNPLVDMNVAVAGPVTVVFPAPMFVSEHDKSVHNVITTLVEGVTSGIATLNNLEAFNSVVVPVKIEPANE